MQATPRPGVLQPTVHEAAEEYLQSSQARRRPPSGPGRRTGAGPVDYTSHSSISMKSGVRWLVILGVVLFMGYVVFGTVTRAEVSCEACLRFEGELVCRRGAGATEAEARMAAQESACGGNASGMSEVIACRNQTPERVQCTTG